jgi:hypothetical protein
MKIPFLVLAALVVVGCDEHKPRLLSDCGDNCGDGGEVAPDAGSVDAGDAGDGGDAG